jgi:hypothetical protein
MVSPADKQVDHPPPGSRSLTTRGEISRSVRVVARKRLIAWVEVGERSLYTIKDALDTVGAWDQQELPMLGVGDELSDEDRAHGSGLESIETAEIEKDSPGARLESLFETAVEAVRARPAEIAEQLDSDDVLPLRDADLKPGGLLRLADLGRWRGAARSETIRAL